MVIFVLRKLLTDFQIIFMNFKAMPINAHAHFAKNWERYVSWGWPPPQIFVELHLLQSCRTSVLSHLRLTYLIQNEKRPKPPRDRSRPFRNRRGASWNWKYRQSPAEFPAEYIID